jgi:uncharacterized UBP type Zn finger protein
MGEKDKRRLRLAESMRRIFWGGKIMNQDCSHLNQINEVTPSAEGCEDCLKIGDTWVHLRLCLICGHVGCCDNSKNRHATAHFHETGHPLIASFEPDEDWVWCYVDRVLMSPEQIGLSDVPSRPAWSES